MWNWAKNDWINSGGEEVKNLELIKILYRLANENMWGNYTVKKTIGHSGILGNELADALARLNESKIRKIFKENEDDIEKYF